MSNPNASAHQRGASRTVCLCPRKLGHLKFPVTSLRLHTYAHTGTYDEAHFRFIGPVVRISMDK